MNTPPPPSPDSTNTLQPALDRLFATMERRKQDQRDARRQLEDAKLARLTRRHPLWWQDGSA
jgi:hypothetical protein